jgi:predicted nucleotidyltransferase
MYLDPKSEIAGVSALSVRDFLKRWQRRDWSVESVAESLKLSAARARALVARLIALGLATPSREFGRRYVNTIAGNQLANASAARALTRTTAERKVAELLARVQDVNSNPYYLYRVTRVRVFGSYLTDVPRLNDIDLVVEIASKAPDHTIAHELDMERVDVALRAGRQFSNIVDEQFWPQNEVILHLKARSRAYSFHSPSDAILNQVSARVLFESEYVSGPC